MYPKVGLAEETKEGGKEGKNYQVTMKYATHLCRNKIQNRGQRT
jgi:hypothetical protein